MNILLTELTLSNGYVNWDILVSTQPQYLNLAWCLIVKTTSSIFRIELQLSLSTVQMAVSPKFNLQDAIQEASDYHLDIPFGSNTKTSMWITRKGRVKTTVIQGLYFSQKLTEFFHQTFLCLHTFVCGTQWGCNNNQHAMWCEFIIVRLKRSKYILLASFEASWRSCISNSQVQRMWITVEPLFRIMQEFWTFLSLCTCSNYEAWEMIHFGLANKWYFILQQILFLSSPFCN